MYSKVSMELTQVMKGCDKRKVLKILGERDHGTISQKTGKFVLKDVN